MGLLDNSSHFCSHILSISSKDDKSSFFSKGYFTFFKMSVNVSLKDLLLSFFYVTTVGFLNIVSYSNYINHK